MQGLPAELNERHPDPRQQPAGALVVGGALGSLAMARSLGRRGIPVRFLTSDNTIAGYSRYTARSALAPSPERPEALPFLLDYGARHGLQGWVLFAGGDPEVRLIAENHEVLATMFRVTTPPWESTRWGHNKRLTYERAAALGIDHPRVISLRSRGDVLDGDFRFPVVLKPTSRELSNAFTAAKAWRADDRPALIALYDQAASMVGQGDVVVQEYIPGDGGTQFSWAALCDRGVPVASVVALRRRQYPVEFGTGTLVQTVTNQVVEAAGARFVASMNYTGLVEIEFKLDTRDGSYRLLDVNPRIWNWISLGDKAGVEFSWLAWQLAMGEPFQPAKGRAGVSWLHLSRDLVGVARQISRGTLSVGGYLASFRGPKDFSIAAADDPLPALLEVPVVLSRKLRGLSANSRRPAGHTAIRAPATPAEPSSRQALDPLRPLP